MSTATFAYGTLLGHPASGEELFTISINDDEQVAARQCRPRRAPGAGRYGRRGSVADVAELTDEQFEELYGAWQPLPLSEVGAVMGPLRWWVVGGWALELATGVSRPHHDVDIAIPREDLPRAAAHLRDYHLWAAHRGTLTPLRRLDPFPDDHEQLWIRRNAQSPWIIDLLLQPVVDEHWVFKRDPGIRVPMSRAIRTSRGIPYLSPELALLHKAHLVRPQDDADLEAALPTLADDQRHWLARAVTLAVPDSPWNDRLLPG